MGDNFVTIIFSLHKIIMIRNRINIKIEERGTEYKKYEKVRRLIFILKILRHYTIKREREREREERITYSICES